MTLNELKREVDFHISLGDGEKQVVITLSQPSVGARACCGVERFDGGFDFESGQIRIEPSKNICERGREKSAPQQKYSTSVSDSKGKTRVYLFCPQCHEPSKKDANWCSNCGQRLCN